MMTRIFCAGACVAALVGAVVLAADKPVAAPASQPAAASGDILTKSGLTKIGQNFTLQAEQTLSQGMRDLAKAKTKMDADNRARLAVEKEIDRAKTAYAQWENERRGELEKLAKVKDAFQNNQIVAKIEALESKMKEAVKYRDEQNKALAKIGDDSRTKYIEDVIKLAETAEKASAKYAELAKEKEVTDAVASAKGKLGPTPEFTQQFNLIKRMRAPIFAETIKVTFEGKVPFIEVALNGSTTRKMVLDSGSSTVCIPADLAKAMELVPGPNDPDVQLQLADGKLVTAKLSKLKSVRVGQFTVNDVECAILPPELVAAQPLLGGSFLNNFTYKLDVAKEELHLARIGGDPKDTTKKPGAK
jgi:hypothetical protein